MCEGSAPKVLHPICIECPTKRLVILLYSGIARVLCWTIECCRIELLVGLHRLSFDAFPSNWLGRSNKESKKVLKAGQAIVDFAVVEFEKAAGEVVFFWIVIGCVNMQHNWQE